jgi:hypothetical protein
LRNGVATKELRDRITAGKFRDAAEEAAEPLQPSGLGVVAGLGLLKLRLRRVARRLRSEAVGCERRLLAYLLDIGEAEDVLAFAHVGGRTGIDVDVARSKTGLDRAGLGALL